MIDVAPAGHHGEARRPSVSVLIPAYEIADVLPRAVASALAQLEGDVEVIVVDDASPSGDTARVAKHLADTDHRVHMIRRTRNDGPGAARTEALDVARGTWVAVLDADDRMLPGRLHRLVAHAQRHQLDLIADNLELVDPVAGPAGRAFPIPDQSAVPLSPERVLVNCVPGGRVNLGWMKPVVRRSFLVGHGITWRSLRHAEDVLFTLEVLAAGARGVLIGEVGYAYTQRRGTLSGVVSPHSRTTRDAAAQLRAFAIFEETASDLTPTVQDRLDNIRDEIRVTEGILAMREAAERGSYGEAAVQATRAMRRPRALARCIAARYGPSSRRVI